MLLDIFYLLYGDPTEKQLSIIYLRRESSISCSYFFYVTPIRMSYYYFKNLAAS